MENEKNSIEALEAQGFEFNPNDVVLIVEYLVKMIEGHRFPEKRINCVDIYDHSPKSLASFPSHAGVKWYFYTKLNLKYFGGTKPVRKTKDGGVWKCKGTYRIREEGGKEIGLRRVLKYKEKGGNETEWVMWEYTATATNQVALCKLFKKDCKRARAARSLNAAQENDDLDVADGTSYGIHVDVPEGCGADNRPMMNEHPDVRSFGPQVFLVGSALAGGESIDACIVRCTDHVVEEEARVVGTSDAPHLNIAEGGRSYGLVSDVSEARCAETFHSSGRKDESAAVGTSHFESSGPPSDIAEGTSYGLIPEEHTHSVSWEVEGFDLGSIDVHSMCQPWDIASSGLNLDLSEVRGAETVHTTGWIDEDVDVLGTSHVQILGPQGSDYEGRVGGYSPLRGQVIDVGQSKSYPVMNSADKWILEAQELW